MSRIEPDLRPEDGEGKKWVGPRAVVEVGPARRDLRYRAQEGLDIDSHRGEKDTPRGAVSLLHSFPGLPGALFSIMSAADECRVTHLGDGRSSSRVPAAALPVLTVPRDLRLSVGPGLQSSGGPEWPLCS